MDFEHLSHVMHILMIWHDQYVFIWFIDQETIGLDTKCMTMNELVIELWLIFDFVVGHLGFSLLSQLYGTETSKFHLDVIKYIHTMNKDNQGVHGSENWF